MPNPFDQILEEWRALASWEPQTAGELEAGLQKMEHMLTSAANYMAGFANGLEAGEKTGGAPIDSSVADLLREVANKLNAAGDSAQDAHDAFGGAHGFWRRR